MSHMDENSIGTRIADFNPTESMLLSLKQTKPWVRFLSILGFLAVAMMLTVGVFSQTMLSALVDPSMVIPSYLILIVYGLMSLLYFFPSLFLYRYASAIARLVQSEAAEEMEKALSMQKSFWRYIGIFALVMLIFPVLGMIAAIALPLLAA